MNKETDIKPYENKIAELEREIHILGEKLAISTAISELDPAYRILVDNNLFGLGILQDNKLVFVNNTFSKFLKIPQDNLTGITISDILEYIHPDDRAFILETIRGAMNNNKISSRNKHRILDRDGNVLWVKVYASYVTFKERPALLVSYSDITRQIKAENKVHEKTTFIEKIARTSPDIITLYDHSLGRNLFESRSLLEELGYAGEEKEKLMFDPVAVIHPDDLGILKKIAGDLAHLEDNRRYEYDTRYKDTCNQYHWYRRSMSVFARDPDNIPYQFVSIFQDITAMKNSLEEVKSARNAYEQVINSISDIVWTFTMDYHWHVSKVFFSPVIEKVTGFSRDFFTDNFATWEKLVLDEDVENLRSEHIAAFIKRKNKLVVFFRIRNKSGKIIHLRNSINIRYLDDHIEAYGIAADITAQAISELERQKIEKLESIGILAGGIAHDFNNILTSTVGNLSLVKMLSSDSPRLQERIIEAERSCQRATELTQRLLTFAKGGKPIIENIEISEIIDESANLALSGSKCVVNNNRAKNLWHIQGDSGQLNQVFNNLFINARQAMTSGGTINIYSENQLINNHSSLEDGPYIKITFQDDGPGIPQNILNKIFDPYFTTKKNGSGLGLASVYSIINRHKGLILAESELDHGTRFTIYLPANPEKGKTEKKREASVQKGEGKILILDDEPVILDV